MGLYGNVYASRVWKGEGEETEQFLACPFLYKGQVFCFMLTIKFKTKKTFRRFK